MKKLLCILIILGLAAAGVGCSSSSGKEDVVYDLKMHHAGPEGHPYYLGAERFKELVEEKSDGKIRIDIFPNNEISAGAKAVEAVQMGTLDIALESSMAIGGFVPEMGVLDLPFLFGNREEVKAVMDGEIGAELSARAEEKGFKVLYYWDNGFRNISNSHKPILTPNDLRGLKIRVPESKIYIATFEALGAIPTPMAFNELFTALQLGTVDGQENPNGHMITYNLYEVQKYFSITNHIYTAEPLIIRGDLFDKMPPEYQQILLDAAREAGEYQRQLSADREADYLKQITEKQVEVSYPELEPFRDAVKPVYDVYRQQYGDLVDRIFEAEASLSEGGEGNA
ncbi:MAG: TRAP transporter substrate-binding protein [Ruminococcaceae bacterium]|nr:TRAP transporter substrate-binding protein [Oscillospiraceae bacterium]